MMCEQLVIFGAGGHAKVVVDAIERQGRYEIAFLADAAVDRVGMTVAGYSVIGEEEGFSAPSKGIRHAIIAIGNNEARKRVAEVATSAGFDLVTVIHPAAVTAPTARIGVGTLVMPGCVINADAYVGNNVIVNTGAVVEHDCVVGDDVHIAPNATLCGGVQVGPLSLVGAGATVLVGVRVGAGAVIGAGSTVLYDVPDGKCAVGTPCRILEKKV